MNPPETLIIGLHALISIWGFHNQKTGSAIVLEAFILVSALIAPPSVNLIYTVKFILKIFRVQV